MSLGESSPAMLRELYCMLSRAIPRRLEDVAASEEGRIRDSASARLMCTRVESIALESRHVVVGL